MTFSRRRPRQLVVPSTVDDSRLKTGWLQPTENTIREQENILANMYFLVRQGDTFGERLKCVDCGGRHDYITLRCVPKPVNGLANGLYAYYRAIKDTGREHDLRPEEQTRFDTIIDLLMQMPDLSRTHPQLARQFVKDVGPKDAQLGAVSLGILEPISPTEARKLADDINTKGIRPRFELGIIQQHEVDRMLEYRGPKRYNRSRW
jgi:hypothetical protein